MVLFLLLNGEALGQLGSPDLKVKISATVVDYLEMVTIADIDVGTVIPSDDVLHLNPRLDQGAGIIHIRGRENSSVQITFSSQVEMVNISSNSTLTVNYSVSGNREGDQSASVLFTTNPANVILSNNGEYTLWIGCEFSLLNLVSGQYDGDFVVDVDYN